MRVMKQTAGKDLQAGNRARGSQKEISRAACKKMAEKIEISIYGKRQTPASL